MSNDDRDSRRGDRSTTISNPVLVGSGELDRVGTIGSISGTVNVNLSSVSSSAGTISATITNPSPTTSRGSQQYTSVYDQHMHIMLSQILTEIKRTNAHLYAMTEEEFNDNDL
jgi:hypothetical protein